MIKENVSVLFQRKLECQTVVLLLNATCCVCGDPSLTGKMTFFNGFVAWPQDMKGLQDSWQRVKPMGSTSNQPPEDFPPSFVSAFIQSQTWRSEHTFIIDLLLPHPSCVFLSFASFVFTPSVCSFLFFPFPLSFA